MNPLQIQNVTVNRLGRDNGHLGSLTLDDTTLTFHDDNGSQEVVPLSSIKRIETDGKLTMRIFRRGGPRLQIWMYDFFARLKVPFTPEEQLDANQTTRAWVHQLIEHGVRIKVYTGRELLIQASIFGVGLIAFIVGVIFVFLKFDLGFIGGLFIAIASVATIVRQNIGVNKEKTHRRLLTLEQESQSRV